MIQSNARKIKYVVSGLMLFSMLVTQFVLLSNRVTSDDYLCVFILYAVIIASVFFGITLGLIASLVGVIVYGGNYFFQAYVLELRFGLTTKDMVWLFLIPIGAIVGGYLGDGVIFVEKLFKKYSRQLESLLRSGQLGMVGNEVTFQEDLKEECSRSKRSLANFTLLLLQIGNLDNLQRLMGIDASIEASKKLSESICRSTRDIDKKAKLGVSLYGLILPDTSRAETDVVLERIRKNLLKVQIDYRGRKLRADIDLIAGVANYPETGRLPEKLMEAVIKDLESLGKGHQKIVKESEKEIKKTIGLLKSGGQLGVNKLDA